MKLADKIKGLTGDFLYSVLGLVCMNGVIQLLLYPYFNRQMGADRFGVVLTLLSIVSIMGSTFGVAANYSRMVSRTKGQDANGDYNIFLLSVAVLSAAVSAVGLLWLGQGGILYSASYYLLMVVTVLRYYADVQFRLTVNFKRFFIYYLLISAGYAAGVALYPVTGSWTAAMLAGEALAVAYVIWKGNIFSRPLFEQSPYFKANMKSVVLLSATELIAALVLNADRLMLQMFAGGMAVTVFYAATLIGKMISLISMPLNGVIMGHLGRYKGKLPPRVFLGICGGSLAAGALLNAACVGVSYIFIKVMYADIYEQVIPYLWLANAGQVFYFLSNTLTVILLRFTDEKFQLYINIIYLAAFLTLAVPMTFYWKLWGMAWALLLVNLLKIIVIAAFGKVQLGKSGWQKEEEQA